MKIKLHIHALMQDSDYLDVFATNSHRGVDHI